MEMSKHSITYHKHPTFSVLMSPATHIYIKKVHECMCGLWYRHVCHMADDLNQVKILSNYQAHQTCFPYISPPSYRSMNLIEPIHLTVWTVLQKTLKYFQLFDRNYEEYAEQKVARTHFLAPKGDALSNILPQFQTSLYIGFHCLKFPIHFCVSLDRWQADTDDRQIYFRMVTQEQLHIEQGRLPILSSIWVIWL